MNNQYFLTSDLAKILYTLLTGFGDLRRCRRRTVLRTNCTVPMFFVCTQVRPPRSHGETVQESVSRLVSTYIICRSVLNVDT